MPLIEEDYKYEHPNKPGKLVSRQRIWQLKQRENGKCPSCGKRRGKNKDGYCKHCDAIRYPKSDRRQQRGKLDS